MRSRSNVKGSFSRRVGVFVLTASSVGVLFWLLQARVSVFTSRTSAEVADGQAAQKQSQAKGKTCPHCSPPGFQEIYLPLIDLPEAAHGELVFNSRSPEAMDVTPTFYRQDGSAVVGDPVTVQSAEIRYVDIKRLMPARYRQETGWGGFSLSYYGTNREMWSQFRFMNVNGGSNVDEFFTVKEESRADKLEAVWWVPEGAESIIALGNVTDTATSATIDFGVDRGHVVRLAPHATEILRHPHDARARTESAAITVTGAPGSIVPTGVITSTDGSFNSVIRFYGPKLAKQPNLYANGFRVKGNTPHMVLKNTTSSSIAVGPRFLPLSGKGAAPVILPPVTLPPNESIEVDLAPLLRAASRRDDLDVVSVTVANQTGPGSIIGSLYGINQRTGVNYDIPLRDSGPVRAMTGSYPWKLTDDFTTVVYITNISDQKAGFVGQINFESGHFVIDPHTLAPGETAVFDLAQIRDQQFTDNTGSHVPQNVSLGQFKWAVHGVTNGKLLLIGRAEMVSRSRKISTSYSCNDPCPPYYWGWIGPLPPIVIINNSTSASVWQSCSYNSGYTMGPFSASAGWSVDGSTISASPSTAHTTTISGDDFGEGCVTADMGSQERYSWDGQNCYDDNVSDPMSDMGCVQVGDVRIMQGSTNITGGTHDAIVGQQMSLSLQVVGTTTAADHIQWAVPGNRIANFVTSSTAGTVTTLSDLQSAGLTFYWIDGADNRAITLSCKVAGTQFNKSTTFNVKRPTSTLTSATGTPDVFTPAHGGLAGQLALEYGDPSPGTPGINFTESVTFPQGFTGDLEWIQVVDTTRTRTTNANVVKTLQGTGADNAFPYSFVTSTTTQDSPGAALTTDYIAYSISDSFTMYLMFKPAGTGAIWVPLRQIAWSWSASATRSGGGNNWTRTARSNDSNPSSTESTDCPTWTQNVSSLSFQ